MDKYLKLIHDLEAIIDKLQSQIAKKEEEKNQEDEDYTTKCARQIDILKELDKVKTNIRKLKQYDGKNLVLEPLKEIGECLVKLFENLGFGAKIIIGGFLAVFVILISLVPVVGIIFLIGMVESLMIILGLNAYNVLSYRKKFNILDLEDSEKELMAELVQIDAFKKGHTKRVRDILQNKKSLEIEKEEFESDLRTVKASRDKALGSLVSEVTLDDCFDKSLLSDIVSRVTI